MNEVRDKPEVPLGASMLALLQALLRRLRQRQAVLSMAASLLFAVMFRSDEAG